VHKGLFKVRLDGDGFSWFRANGTPVPQAPRQPRGDCTQVASTRGPRRTSWSLYPDEARPGGHLGWSVDSLLDSRVGRRESPPRPAGPRPLRVRRASSAELDLARIGYVPLVAVNNLHRNETELEREDRNFTELLQELRVVVTGVQVLFAVPADPSVQQRLRPS